MSTPLLDWLEALKNTQEISSHNLNKHKKIADHLLNSKNILDLGILVKATDYHAMLVVPEHLELKCTEYAPYLLEKLRTVGGFNKSRIESNILRNLKTDEALRKANTWYTTGLPEHVQIILAWKLYNELYAQLTTGQVADKVLNTEQSKLIVEFLNLVPTTLNAGKAVLFVLKAAAYVLRTGDETDFVKHQLPHNYNEIILNSVWTYTKTQVDPFEREKWNIHAASITLMNNKLIPANLAWLQMYDNQEYKKLNTYINADTKDINNYLNRQRNKVGNPEPLIAKRHADNNPGDLSSVISF